MDDHTTEADYLTECGDRVNFLPTEEELEEAAERREAKLADLTELLESRYNKARNAKVGSMISCPVCGRQHQKTTYHKVFCSNQKHKTRKAKGSRKSSCKDQYWNTVDDTRRERAVYYNGK